MLKKIFYLFTILTLIGLAHLHAENIVVVNFAKCATESKYGKFEKEQIERIGQQWSSLIEETQKELKSIEDKLQDQNYKESLSPQAEKELKQKQQTLFEDLNKYQMQLNHILTQANYYFIQKISENISKATEKIAKEKNLASAVIINKEACFYFDPKLDITETAIKEMDKNFEQDLKDKKLSENKEITPKNKDPKNVQK